MGNKLDIENFSKDNCFALWKVKIQSSVTQKKCIQVLNGEASMYAYLI